MMTKLTGFAERLVEARRRRIIVRIAARLKGMSVAVEETRLVVSGKGLTRRWLIDPELRFLSGDKR